MTSRIEGNIKIVGTPLTKRQILEALSLHSFAAPFTASPVEAWGFKFMIPSPGECQACCGDGVLNLIMPDSTERNVRCPDCKGEGKSN